MMIATCIPHVVKALKTDCEVREREFVSVQLNAGGSINLYYRELEIDEALRVQTFDTIDALEAELEL